MIKWNEYTWYSKLLAALFFILVLPVLAFHIGRQYEITKQVLEYSYSSSAVENEIIYPRTLTLSEFDSLLDPGYVFESYIQADLQQPGSKEIIVFEINKEYDSKKLDSNLIRLLVIDINATSSLPFVAYKEDYSSKEQGIPLFEIVDIDDGKKEVVVTRTYQTPTAPYQQTIIGEVNGVIDQVSKANGNN